MPSTASLARIFREAGVARLEPKKKPRSAWRRFVYPAPNACWQLDGTEYVLTGGRRCVILQLIDDHSRYALASHVAWGETSEAAITVFDKAVAAHGVPQRLLSDNGASLNPSRRGVLGQLVVHVMGLGVEPITGKPYKPTTQGKNERFHQTLFRYLDKQPLASSLAELQAQVDAFDHIYNTERPHQGLPGRVTPLMAWEATTKAEAPRPTPRTVPQAHRPAIPTNPRADRPEDLAERHPPQEADHRRHVQAGQASPTRSTEDADSRRSSIITDGKPGDKITVADLEGEILIEHTRPAPGVTYVGNGRPRGPHPSPMQTSPMS